MARGVVEAEQDLDNGVVGQAAWRIEGFDQLPEGQVWVAVGIQGGGFDLGEQRGAAGVAVEADAEWQGVDEQADEGFEVGVGAVGDGGADDEVGLPAESGQEDGPGGEQGHE